MQLQLNTLGTKSGWHLRCYLLLQTPDMYADVPPAPPGLIWWEYRPGVPPLPQPVTYFGLSNWTNWGWRYDPDYAVPFYQYSNIDKVSCDVAATMAWIKFCKCACTYAYDKVS